MRWALSLVLVAAAQAPAAAQPSTVVPLSDEEQAILASGPITPGEQFGGAALGLVVGFGTGQGVQGRLARRGWLFTLADVTLVAAGGFGYVTCLGEDGSPRQRAFEPDWCLVAGVGMLGLAASHVWQAVDALVAPASHNRRLREIRARQNSRLRYMPTPPGWRSFVVPSGDGAGAVAGAAVAF